MIKQSGKYVFISLVTILVVTSCSALKPSKIKNMNNQACQSELGNAFRELLESGGETKKVAKLHSKDILAYIADLSNHYTGVVEVEIEAQNSIFTNKYQFVTTNDDACSLQLTSKTECKNQSMTNIFQTKFDEGGYCKTVTNTLTGIQEVELATCQC